VTTWQKASVLAATQACSISLMVAILSFDASVGAALPMASCTRAVTSVISCNWSR
jgi:hypothetical protein